MNTPFKNASLLKIYSNFLELLAVMKAKATVLLTSSFIGLAVGVIYSFTLIPEFSVTGVIGPNIAATGGRSESSTASFVRSLNNMATGGSGENAVISEFYEAMYTYPTAKILWDKGYNKVFFGDSYNEQEDKYLLEEPSLSTKFGSWILDYDLDLLNKEITPVNLQDLITAKIIYTDPGFNLSANVDFVAITSNPALWERFMLDVFLATDQVLKENKIAYANSQISFLEKKLETVSNVGVRSVMFDSIQKHVLVLTLASSELPYSMQVIEEPRRSNNVIRPSLLFIYGVFSFLGFAIPLIYFSFRSFLYNDSL